VIAPFRSASLEAAAGKNPISHVGKLYNMLALLAARDIVDRVPAVGEIQIYILSQIGKPLDQPLVASASVTASNGSLSAGDRAEIEDILNQHLADFSGLRAKILNMEISPF
jgi:S-adenosylmethionine synthetase